MLDCDFIPPAYHAMQTMRRSVRRRSICVAGMFVMMLVWVVVHGQQIKSAEAMLTNVSSQQKQLGLMAEKKLELEKEQGRLLEHVKLIASLSDHASRVIILSEISRCLPETVVLTELSIKSELIAPYLVELKKPSLEPGMGGSSGTVEAARVIRPVEPPTLRIAGIALSPTEVIEFAARMERSTLFDHVYTDVRGASVWGGRKAETFELTCELLPQEEAAP